MLKIQQKPWATGPKELLDHADSHINLDKAFDHRIALISIDNAVELMMRTFLSLPKRARGRDGPPRKRIEAAIGFPDLIDLIEEYAGDLIHGIELGDIEWFHRIRNNLYHEGNGITVDKAQLISYREIARILYENLFDIKLPSIASGPTGAFLESWAELENRIKTAAMDYISKPHQHPPEHLVKILLEHSVVNDEFVSTFSSLREQRNLIAHGYAVPGLDAHYIISRLMGLIDMLPPWRKAGP